MAAQIHVEPADDDGHGRISAHGHEEQSSILDRAVVVYSNENGETGDADSNRKKREEEAVLEAITEPGYYHGKPECSGPRRHAVKLGLDRAVAVALDNTRREVGVSIGRNNQSKVHEASDNDLGIAEDSANIRKSNWPFPARPSLINLQPCFDKSALVLAKPLGLLREIGQKEVEEEGDNDRQETFENEDPAPAAIASHVVHLTNGTGKETAKGTSEGRAGEEECVTTLGFVTTVPMACWLFFQVEKPGPYLPHANQIKSARKHACLKDAQEEACGEES